MNDFKKLTEKLNSNNEDNSSVEELSVKEFKGLRADRELSLIELAGKRNYYVIVGLFLFNILLSGYNIILNESDDIAISYSLPDIRNMDAPVLLKEIDSGTVSDIDNLVKGFVRQYMRARYPKNSLEAETMYTFIARHSSGDIQRDFDGRIGRLVEIGRMLDSGNTVNIYPKSSEDLKIRKDGVLGGWIAEFDGRYVADIGTSESARAYVKVRLEIVRSSPSIKNSPSGFYVNSYKVTYVKDGITNEIGEVGI